MIRPSFLLAISIAAFAGVAPAAAQPSDGEAELAQMLEGREPGEPQRCLNMRQVRSTTIIEGTAIVYRAAGGVLYVNRPRVGADALDDRDTMVSVRSSTRLCIEDTLRMTDPFSGIVSGTIFLSDFVPYRRVGD